MLFLLLVTIVWALKDPLHDILYNTLEVGPSCVRRLNASGAVGCGTKGTRVAGKVKVIKTSGALDVFIETGHGDEKYALVLSAALLRSNVLMRLEDSVNIAGVIVLNDSDTPFSPELSTLFNPTGDGLLLQRFSFPVTLSQPTDDLRNSDGQVAEFSFPMLAPSSSNASTCIATHTCLPIGGYSIWSSIQTVSPTQQWILVSAPLDSLSFFPQSAIGFSVESTAQIVLTAAFHTLSQMNGVNESDVNLIFALFDGESFDHIGSSRFVHDLLDFECRSVSKDGLQCETPRRNSLEFKNLNTSLLLSHLSLSNLLADHLYTHQTSVNSISTNIALAAKTLNISISQSPSIPPSTATSISQFLPSLASAAISDFNSTFNTLNYHSYLDMGKYTPDQVKVLCTRASIIARSLLLEISEQTADISAVNADCTFVSQLSECLSQSLDCSLSRNLDVLSSATANGKIPSKYSGVFLSHESPKDHLVGHMSLLHALFASFSSQTFLHEAFDIGFEVSEDGTWFDIVNQNTSLWTESYWSNFWEVRLYTPQNTSTAIGAIVISVIIVMISISLSFLIVPKIH